MVLGPHNSNAANVNGIGFALCGLCTSFTAANEMPALCWLAIVGGLLLLIDARRTLLAYVPALLPVAIAFFVTNYIAHGVWRPAYTHRDLGAKLFELPVASGSSLSALSVDSLIAACQENKLNFSPTSVIRPARRDDVYETVGRSWTATIGASP